MNAATPFLVKKPSSLRYFQEGPQPVDLASWRLTITGDGVRKAVLDIDALRALPAEDHHRRAVCVCLWTIKRPWRGVALKKVLELTGVDTTDEGLYLRQSSIGTDKGIYDSTIHLASAVRRNAVLAYEVDDAPLTLEGGFPLRLLDFGLYLYKCVKALARLEVTRIAELGHWEKYAGYELDGTVQPKKYYAVDLQRKIWFGRTGEVLDNDL